MSNSPLNGDGPGCLGLALLAIIAAIIAAGVLTSGGMR